MLHISTQQSPTSPLYQQAKQVLASNQWSIVPLIGKRPPPGFVWSAYQQRRPTQAEVDSWFEQYDLTGIGILGGAVSGLAIIEFDTLEAYCAFHDAFPHLTETYTVRSAGRGLPHLYFSITEPVANIEGTWGSVRCEGKYVVGAFSEVNGKTYDLINDVPPLELTLNDYNAIRDLLQPARPAPATWQVGVPVSISTLVEQYQQQAKEEGRNNALYRAASHARGAGIDKHTVLEAFVDLHAEMKPSWPHKPETFRQRQREARDTIQSAYKGPLYNYGRLSDTRNQTVSNSGNAAVGTLVHGGAPAAPTHQQQSTPVAPALAPRDASAVATVAHSLGSTSPKTHTQATLISAPVDLLSTDTDLPALIFTALPNQAREALLKLDNGPEAVRLLELLYTTPQEIFTKQELLDLASRAGLSLATVNKALKLRIGDVDVFKRIEMKVEVKDKDTPTTPAGYAGKTFSYAPCLLLNLCDLLDITDRRSDVLPFVALASNKAYRLALHEALLRNRPGQYGLDWLAQRLNVTPDTIRNYNAELGVITKEVYEYVYLDWKHISNRDYFYHGDDLRENGVTPGYFLVDLDELDKDGNHKRYPSKEEIARKLLAQKHRVIAVRRRPNFYCLDPALAPAGEALWQHWHNPQQISATANSHDLPPNPYADEDDDAPKGHLDLLDCWLVYLMVLQLWGTFRIANRLHRPQTPAQPATCIAPPQPEAPQPATVIAPPKPDEAPQPATVITPPQTEAPQPATIIAPPQPKMPQVATSIAPPQPEAPELPPIPELPPDLRPWQQYTERPIGLGYEEHWDYLPHLPVIPPEIDLDLTQLNELGPRFERVLQENGIYTLRHLIVAGMEYVVKLKWPSEYVGYYKVERWIQQAYYIVCGQKLFSFVDIPLTKAQQRAEDIQRVLSWFDMPPPKADGFDYAEQIERLETLAEASRKAGGPRLTQILVDACANGAGQGCKELLWRHQKALQHERNRLLSLKAMSAQERRDLGLTLQGWDKQMAFVQGEQARLCAYIHQNSMTDGNTL